MLVKVNSVAFHGIETLDVTVEVNISNRGFPSFDIVGLPSKAVSESRERIRAAIVNSGFEFPAKRITVNLAPADIPKRGSFYDLPIAIGILSALSNICLPDSSIFWGELSLDGSIKSAKGIFLAYLHAQEAKFDYVFLPEFGTVAVKGEFNTLSKLVTYLKSSNISPNRVKRFNLGFNSGFAEGRDVELSSFSQYIAILGQQQAKRALEIAAAGGHNLMLSGPPGSGKTLLAKALVELLPLLSSSELIEVAKIYSSAGLEGALLGGTNFGKGTRPFRSPHHTCTYAGFVGGGSIPKPGEISLAHRGVLFLDELPEYTKRVVEALRQPLEDNIITITRSGCSYTFPCNFTLVAAMNPCPCGHLGSVSKDCICPEHQIVRYKSKVSGPILDRFDLFVSVDAQDIAKLHSKAVVNAEFAPQERKKASSIFKNIQKARGIQLERYRKTGFILNSDLDNAAMSKYCVLSPKTMKYLNLISSKFNLSARAYFRVIKVSRTIADLANSKEILSKHISEAFQFRQG